MFSIQWRKSCCSELSLVSAARRWENVIQESAWFCQRNLHGKRNSRSARSEQQQEKRRGDMEEMKVAVIGAGAMGCLYGAYLSRNNEVVMLDTYGPQVVAINKKGITVQEENGEEVPFRNVKAFISGEYRERADLAVIFVKSTCTKAALESNKELFDEHTIVMTLQNGAGNDRKIAKYVKPENIVIGTSKHNSVNLGEGKCRHRGAGVTTIGSNYKAEDTLRKINDMLEAAGFRTEVSADIQRIIWSKLFVNLSVNTFTAITKTPIGYMVENEAAWNFAKRLIYEAVDVAEEDGTYFDRREVLESVRKTCIDAGDGYSSMYQDCQKGIRTEIDAINGAIVEQAKLYGVPVPYNSLIVDLIHAIEGTFAYNKQHV